MKALGLEEGFSVGEEEELRSGHASTPNYNLARSQALRREIMLMSTPVRNDAAPFGGDHGPLPIQLGKPLVTSS